MGWKNIKTHFQIGHIVRKEDDGSPDIIIGSGYIPCLIRVTPDGTVRWGDLGERCGSDLQRYFDKMSANPEKVRKLIEAPDTFTASLPVYTFRGADILEKRCEAYKWPNVTHDGFLMFDNLYFRRKPDAAKRAMEEAEAGISLGTRAITEAENRLTDLRNHLQCDREILAKLTADFPDVKTRKEEA